MKTKKQAKVKKDFKEELKAIPQEKKSKFVLWAESYEPIIEIVDMRAVLK
jgi:ribosomal protein L7Ae-like RNA K-turn-binding protein